MQNREVFLAQSDVSDFIDWLVANLPSLDIHLRFAPSRFVPGGLDQRVSGIQSVLRHYHWANSWFDDQDHVVIQSGDWASTTKSLQLLRERLQSALNDRKCNATTFKVCASVLSWGGVRGAYPFLRQMCERGELVNYLQACKPLLSLDGSQALEDLNEQTILRFDAGLTKIHALADSSGSPIYDSRVGAAIAMLYALYRRTASEVSRLNFASGSARGQQVRNPGILGFRQAPQFFTTAVPAKRWAQCQLELGWILRETLRRAPHLVEDSSVERQCHALEAALFMIGYDLRCMNTQGQRLVTTAPSKSVQQTPPHESQLQLAQKRGYTWVPTSVPFVKILREFLACSEAVGRTIKLDEFRRHQEQKYTKNTANSYCYPLKETEFDLPNCSLDDLNLIARGGVDGLHALGAFPFIAGDEREQIYLVTAFLVGLCHEIAERHGLKAKDLLVHAGFADSSEGAGVLIRTGRQVGQHFGLLANEQPTDVFTTFFGNQLDDLDDQLRYAAATASKAK